MGANLCFQPVSSWWGLLVPLGSEPFPSKIVDKVVSGAYVDMKELLGNNITLLQQLENLSGGGGALFRHCPGL